MNNWEWGHILLPDINQARRQRLLKFVEVMDSQKTRSIEGIRASLTRKPPLKLSSVPFETSQARVALEAVIGAAAKATIRPADRILLPADIWPRVWTWMAFLIRSAVLKGLPSTREAFELRERVIHASCGILAIPFALDRFSDAGPEIIRKVVRTTWTDFVPIYSDLLFYLADTGHSSFDLIWGQFTTRYFAGDGSPFVRPSQGMFSLEDKSRILVQLLVRGCQTPIIDTWELATLTSFIMMCIPHERDVYHGILSNHVVKWLTATLSHVASHFDSIPGGDMKMLSAVFATCCVYIKKAFQDGYTWIAEALDGHILYTMCKILAKLTMSCTDEMMSELLIDASKKFAETASSIIFFVFYRSVFIRTIRDLKRIRDSGLLDVLSEESPFVDAMETLWVEALEMKKRMRHFDSERGEICMNVQASPSFLWPRAEAN
ncbi:hypothetical protein V5O48_006039 [Marasmius crinis-equi]|uniref:Uncharacterized protein n=1 Tax=Marasmius crinis-equi TaxID=585013 RepID=A0ABR3FKM1_9AGAR